MSWWLYKLRRKRSCEAKAAASQNQKQQKPPPPSPVTPNRASYYFPSGSREREPRQQDNPKLRETRFPRSPLPGDIVFDVVPRRDDDMFRAPRPQQPTHQLKLRPIITSRLQAAGDDDAFADSSSGGAASPTTTMRRMRRRLHLRASTRRKPAELRWVYESVVVVKESAEPEEDFLASMAEMIAANDVRSPRALQDLLACYLALNAADHHRAIVAAFRRAWLDPDRAPPRRQCCRVRGARFD